MRVGRAVKSGVLAGVVAGLLLALLLFFLVEPITDTAICYEQTGLPNCYPRDELVPRWQQKLAFFWVLPLFGVFTGIVFSIFFGGLQPYLPGRSTMLKALVLGVMGFYIYPFLVSLALPPLPPGVEVGSGPRNSVDARSTWYGIFMVTAAAALGLGLVAYHLLVKRYPSRRTHIWAAILSLVIIVGISAVPFLFFPFQAFRPQAPDGLLALLPTYGLLSLVSQFVYWMALALIVGHLWTRAEAGTSTPGTPGTA